MNKQRSHLKDQPKTGCPSCGHDLFQIIEVKCCAGVITTHGEIKVTHREKEVQIAEIACTQCKAVLFNSLDQGRLLEPLEDVFSLLLPLKVSGYNQ